MVCAWRRKAYGTRAMRAIAPGVVLIWVTYAEGAAGPSTTHSIFLATLGVG
jgi:hypothetical protein